MSTRHDDFIGDGPPVNPPRDSERSPERSWPEHGGPVPRDARRPGLEASHHIPSDALTQTESFATLEARLESRSVDERIGSVIQLPAWGGVAVPPLCAALKDRDERVRIAAATGLGKVGDDRAIQPLVEALRLCFSMGSARAQRWLGAILLLSIAGYVIRIALWPPSQFTTLVSYLMLMGVLWRACIIEQRDRSAACAAISEAIGKVAERHSGPDLHRVLPDLWAVSCDHLLQGRAARTAAREAASRIEALTAHHRDLPRPADSPIADGASLPRVAQTVRCDDARVQSEGE